MQGNAHVRFRMTSKIALFATFIVTACVAGCNRVPEAMSSDSHAVSASHVEAGRAFSYLGVSKDPTTPTLGYAASNFIDVSGVWMPDSDDPKKQLVIREQVAITCERAAMTCVELTAYVQQLGPDEIALPPPDSKTWIVNRWDGEKVLASLSRNPSSANRYDRCHARSLTFDIKSARVYTTDTLIPGTGCDIFDGADTYVLQRGQYYVQVGTAQPCLTDYGTCLPHMKQ